MSVTDSRETFTGRVKWFSTKGFGFLTVVSAVRTGDEIFVHYSELGAAPPRRYLEQGEYVEFFIEPASSTDGKGISEKAVSVVGIYEGPLMCETRAAARAQAKERAQHAEPAAAAAPAAVVAAAPTQVRKTKPTAAAAPADGFKSVKSKRDAKQQRR